jgi:hypothetical protein
MFNSRPMIVKFYENVIKLSQNWAVIFFFTSLFVFIFIFVWKRPLNRMKLIFCIEIKKKNIQNIYILTIIADFRYDESRKNASAQKTFPLCGTITLMGLVAFLLQNSVTLSRIFITRKIHTLSMPYCRRQCLPQKLHCDQSK